MDTASTLHREPILYGGTRCSFRGWYLVGDLVLFRASGFEFLEQLIAMGGFLFLSVGMLIRWPTKVGLDAV